MKYAFVAAWVATWLCTSILLAASPPNIILIVTDDQGLQAGCYGDHVAHTPHLDALAARGARFTHAFATTASCSASRSVILTGQHNHLNRQYGHEHAPHNFRTDTAIASLPRMLNEAGYHTILVGKLHVGPRDVYPFDTVLRAPSRNAVRMAEAFDELLKQRDDKPFFLYFCPIDPHRSGDINEDSPYKPNRFGNRERGHEGVQRVRPDPEQLTVPAYLPDTPQTRAELVEYYEAVNRIDQGLGRLIQILEDRGLADNTVIIFTSDHGPAFAGAKTTVYEPGLHVPFVVYHPRQSQPGRVSDAMISFTDITPTLLEFAGALPENAAFHGRSFLPVLLGQDVSDRDKVYASHTFHEVTMYYPMRVVRERRYKLIMNLAHPLPFPFGSDLWISPTWQAQYEQCPDAMYGLRTVHDYLHRPRFELYDLQNDPHESRNLADDPAHATIKARLIDNIKQFQQRTQDPYFSKWTYE